MAQAFADLGVRATCGPLAVVRSPFRIALQCGRAVMSGLVFACIAPHGWLLVPPISGSQGRKAASTRAAMEELGRRLDAAQPETIVLVTPHGLTVDGVFSLLHTPRLTGSLGHLTVLGGNE